VFGGSGVPRTMVLDAVDRARAELALRRWFTSGWSKHPALATDAQIEEAFLAFFPFVRARFDLLGAVFGINNQRKGKTTVQVPKEVPIERTLDLTAPAGETAEFGVQHCELTGDRVWPADESVLAARGMVFRPQRPPPEVADESIRRAIDETVRSTGLDRIDSFSVESARRRISLIHYPLWVFRYTFRGRLYQALIDGQDGRLWVGKAPGSDTFRASVLIGTIAAATFIASTALQLASNVSADQSALALIAFAGFTALALIAAGFRTFRRGGLIEDGPGRQPASTVTLPAWLHTWLRRATTR
jgi:hypothetical protein